MAQLKVRVYKNLHRNCWSVQEYIECLGWRLWNYYTHLVINDPKFIIHEKGRQRVINTKKKNVHAFIEGNLELTQMPPNWPYINRLSELPPKFRPERHIKITYNPYEDINFRFENKNHNPPLERYIINKVYLDIEDGVYI